LKWSTAWKFIKAAFRKWPDGRVRITIAVEEDTRSARANRWLFGVVYKLMLIEMQGRPTEAAKLELHEHMTYHHNPITLVDPFTGEERRTGGPTKTMSVERFSHFVEEVMLEGSQELGIIWPEPRKDEDWREAA
jgi:hypothetical protein